MSQAEIDAAYQDYLYELVHETGFGAPKLWNANAPRNFQAWLLARQRIADDFDKALAIIQKPKNP